MTSIPDPSIAAPSPWPWIGRRPRIAGGRLGERLRRLASRLGVRLAFAQALVLVSALGLAGYLSHVSGELVARRAIDQNVAGETASIRDEFVQKGAGHLPARSSGWRPRSA